MSAAAPWSVKGIDPKAREIAKDLARRSGMTLGEWLNSMIIEDGDEDGYTPLPRRAHAADSFERRGRSRRVDDAYGAGEDGLQRVSASVEALAARLEASERRAQTAIQGVDQAVAGLVRRLDEQTVGERAWGRRLDDISEELKEGHKRLRRFETETGPRTTETFGKVETTLGALAGRLYDMEERQRSSVNELRQRMEAVEKAAPGQDLLHQVGARLDQAQSRTAEALRGLERSFADLDRRLGAAETRMEPTGARETARFEKLAETLSRQVETNRAEMMRRMDTAEAEGRMDRLERTLASVGDQAKAAEQRAAQSIETLGREVLRIAQNLNGRMQRAESTGAEQMARLGETLSGKVERDLGRYAQAVEQRLISADDRHALALEKLGGEITRISDRLSERIAQSERKSAQALEEIGKRLADSSDKIEQRYDRASGELAERMRLSEERTAKLLAEARDSIERRVDGVRPAPLPDYEVAAPSSLAPMTSAEPPSARDETVVTPDWRSAAFQDPTFDTHGWPDDAAGDAAPAAFAEVETPAEAVAEATPFGAPQPFAAFGGADVRDALDATAEALETPVLTPRRPAAAFEGRDDFSDDDFAAETDFVDPRALRGAMGAAAAAGRAASGSTRSAVDAARAAMAAPAPEAPARASFGLNLKKGGKSKLQERLDKQAAKDGSTVRKALLASVTAVALTGGVYGYSRLTDGTLAIPGLGGAAPAAEAAPVALTLTPTEAPTAAALEQAQGLYAQALEQLDAGDTAGLETMKRAAQMGEPAAQLHLVKLYQDGEAGAPKDLAQARAWARRAAESGDPHGRHAYAMYLYDGMGGGRDRPEALRLLLSAAEQGLVDSQYNVARLFEMGDEGIAADPAEALKWYMIAARGGDEEAPAAVTRLSERSTPAAVRAARRAAEAFQVEPLAG
ncbi:tetratricopeptide repeat protein [Brevundimonas sp.]|uniref:tetratricopeptide repeat protein n=1 Tax=Brevundimonas sp. TaxID=1871086 RepID=UPI002FD9E87D